MRVFPSVHGGLPFVHHWTLPQFEAQTGLSLLLFVLRLRSCARRRYDAPSCSRLYLTLHGSRDPGSTTKLHHTGLAPPVAGGRERGAPRHLGTPRDAHETDTYHEGPGQSARMQEPKQVRRPMVHPPACVHCLAAAARGREQVEPRTGSSVHRVILVVVVRFHRLVVLDLLAILLERGPTLLDRGTGLCPLLRQRDLLHHLSCLLLL